MTQSCPRGTTCGNTSSPEGLSMWDLGGGGGWGGGAGCMTDPGQARNTPFPLIKGIVQRYKE